MGHRIFSHCFEADNNPMDRFSFSRCDTDISGDNCDQRVQLFRHFYSGDIKNISDRCSFDSYYSHSGKYLSV